MDISTLGIAVDSKQVDQASTSMDKMTGSAQRAEQATQRMGRSASQAAKEAAAETKNLDKALASAATQGVVIGEAISAGIRGAINAVKALDEMITKVGDLQDLADMSGASAAGLSQMRVAADVAGISMDRVTNMMVMMTRQISAVNDESKGAGKALEVLGLDINKLRGMRGDEQFKLIAERLNQVSDSSGKTALILDIVGRGGAEAAKLFKAMGDELNITTGYTNEQIAAMDDYADANSRARSQLGLTLELVAVEMAPAFAAFRGAIMDTIVALMGMGKESTGLGENKGAIEFAHAVGLGLAHIIDLATKAVLNLIALGKLLGALAASAATLLSGGGMNGVKAIMEGFNEDIAKLRERANFSTVDSFEKRFQALVSSEKKGTEATETELDKRIAAYKRANDKASAEDKAAKRAELKALREAEQERKKEQDFRIKWGRARAIEEGEAVLKANEEYQKKLDAMRKAQAEADIDSIGRAKDEVNAITDRAAKIEEEVANRGRLKSAIEEEHLAILERDRADFEGSETALAILEQKIDAQKRLVAALKSEEVADASEKAAKKSQEAFDKAWEQVGQSLADALMQGGMTAKQFLERTFASMVLRPTIMAGAAGLLGGASAGAAAAGSNPLAGVAGNLLGTVGSLFGAGGIGGSIAAGAGWLTGATTFGGALSAGASLIGTGTLGGVASGLGMLAGALGPVALGVYGLYKLFGSKKGGPKVEGSAGFGAGTDMDFGRFGNEMDQKMSDAVKSVDDTYKRLASLLGATAANVQFGIGVSMDPRGTAPTFLSVNASNGASWRSTGVGRSEEEFQAALAEASAFVIVEGLRSSGIDQEVMAYFDKVSSGLSGAAKLEAVETVAAMAGVWNQLKLMSNVVRGLGSVSLQATENLIKFAGGVDQLAQGLAAYQQNFFDDFEQRQLALIQMTQALNAPGSGWQGFTPDLLATWDKNFFRKVVEGLDLTTEMGQRQFATMMKVAGPFAAYINAIEQSGIEARNAAEAEKARREEALKTERDKRLQALNDARDRLHEAYDRERNQLIEVRDRMNEVARSFEDFSNSIAIDKGLTQLSPAERMQELQRQYSTALVEMEKANYSGESVSRAQGLARELLQSGREMFGSGTGYENLYNQVLRDMDAAEAQAKKQASAADQQLQKMDQQLGWLRAINQNLITVGQALLQFQYAQQNYTAAFRPGFTVPGFATGLDRVPYDNFLARLHKDETVLPAPMADMWRSGELVKELVAVRKELSLLRKENREDAGNTIGATFEAANQSAQVQSEATIRAARQRDYQNRKRPILA